MRSVIGIHAGTGAADGRRAARLKVGLKGATLVELGALTEKPGEPLALTAPGAVVREVSVPFTDWRKATQVAPFEVEGLVPYDLDEAVTALARLQSGADGTRLLVGVAPEDEVGAIIDGYGESARQVHAIVPEAWALYCFGRAIAGTEGKVLLADVRPGRVMLLALDGRQWCGTRTVPLAWHPGDPLSMENTALLRRAAQSLYGGREVPAGLVVTGEGETAPAAPPLQAQAPPPAAPEEVPEEVPEAESVPETESGEVPELLSELLPEPGLEAPAEPASAPRPESGDLSPEDRNRLAEALGVPLLELSGAPGFDSLAQGRGEDEISTGAVAIGLALAATTRDQGLNLRAGALSLDHEAEDAILHRVTGVGIGLLVVMLLLWVDGFVREQAAEVRLNAVTSAMETAFRDAFPSVTRVVDPLMQARTEVKAAGARSLLYGPGGAGALAYLNAVSSAIPKSIKIGVREFSVSGGKMNMEAEASSFDAIDQIKAYIERAPEFEGVTVSNATTSAKDNQVKFRVSATLAGEM